jgi:hypothetical protein
LRPATITTYRVPVNLDARNEIAASVGAHADLGPGYESAVAEGLIERIGEEIDKRVDARLRGAGQPLPPLVATPPAMPPAMPHPSVPQAGPGTLPPPQLAPSMNGQPVPQATPPGPAHRSTGASVVNMILAISSMGLGVGATAVIGANVQSAPAQVVTILFVWVAIAMINVAHARSYWADGGPHHHRHHPHR